MAHRAAINVCVVHHTPPRLLFKTYARIKSSFNQPFGFGEDIDVWQCFPQCCQKRICFNTSSRACINLNFFNPNIVKNATILDPWDGPNFDMVWCMLHWTWEADKWTNWKICLISSTKTLTSQHTIKNMPKKSSCVWTSQQCVLLLRQKVASSPNLPLLVSTT